MQEIDIAAPLLGGLLIGAGAAFLLFATGRVAGVSGIAGGLFLGTPGERAWRGAFLLGLVLAGALATVFLSDAFEPSASSPIALAMAGLLVGVGTRMGQGCTSGHGICGVSRLSPRSLLATATFVATGMLVVFAVRALGGTP